MLLTYLDKTLNMDRVYSVNKHQFTMIRLMSEKDVLEELTFPSVQIRNEAYTSIVNTWKSSHDHLTIN